MNIKTVNGIEVSKICLGTMTWGEQNTEAQAHEQMDYAAEHGINFMDTAEMYPVAPRAETQGLTESYIGNWLAKNGQRERWVIATKATGHNPAFNYLRNGPKLNRAHILAACDDSLRRLQTDYIDLYQMHWPDRPTNMFGQLGYVHHGDPITPIEETLRALETLVSSGKIRAIGVSNETPWGIMQYLRLAESAGLPRVLTIQNPYSLVNRTFEVGLAEMAHRENIALLPYSPLGSGTLTGKYRGGARPEGSRLALFNRFGRYESDEAMQASTDYAEFAEANGLDPAQMALAWVKTRPFVLSTIIGATNMEQLASNIAAFEIDLPESVMAGIERIHMGQPNPAP